MTPQELKDWMASSEVSSSEVSRLLGVDRSTVSRWLSGECRIPAAVGLLVKNIKLV